MADTDRDEKEKGKPMMPAGEYVAEINEAVLLPSRMGEKLPGEETEDEEA